MGQDRFDRIARLLGSGSTRRAGLRAALAGLAGAGAGSPALETEAEALGKDRERRADAGAGRRRRKRCRPACPAGQRCVKGACACGNGGVVCGAACCLIGQECRDGQCATLPEPGECIAPGEPCKGVGRICCEGRTCASGQGGTDDIACYAPKTGACVTTADCVYGTACIDGRCAFDVPPPAGLAQPCSQAAQQLCVTPGAVCTDYTSPDAPAGAHCTLPLRKVCMDDPDCTCYHCDFVDDLAGSDGRTSTSTKACCLPAERACAADQDCCRGLRCTGGTCVANSPACDVCASGCPHTTIEAAIAAASPGDVITIAAGTYTTTPVSSGESANRPVSRYYLIDKPLTLKACEPGAEVKIACPTVGNGSEYYACIMSKATATIEGLTVDGASPLATRSLGFDTSNACSGGLTIRDCEIRNVQYGVMQRCSQTVSINDQAMVMDTVLSAGLVSYNAGNITCAEPIVYTPTPPPAACVIVGSGTVTGCGCQ